MSLYAKIEYWDDRYKRSGDSGAYDWYQSYEDLRHLLTTDVLERPFGGLCSLDDLSSGDPQLLDSNAPCFPSREKCRVLILGCGNSPFGEDMRNDGWTGDIVNVDFSSVVINQMVKKHENKHEREGKQFIAPKMEFVCADISDGLQFDDSSFDLIICKGTLDSILCSEGSVNTARKLVAECDRVLASAHGCFLLVTHANPDNRVVYLEHNNDPTFYWEGICVATVPNSNESSQISQSTPPNHYVYICRKKKCPIEDVEEAEEVSQVSENIGEENVEQNIHNMEKPGKSAK